MDLMACDVPADESGAFNFGNLIKGAVKLLLREEHQMLARGEATTDESGAFSISSLIKGIAHFLKREESLNMARSINDLD